MAGCKEIEATNLGSAATTPQFRDSDEVLAHFRSDRFKKRCAQRNINYDELVFSAVTIRETAVDRAIELKKRGIGPDRVLMMVSTDPNIISQLRHHPFPVLERSRAVHQKVPRRRDQDVRVVSTIWGSPLSGATKLEDAVEFTKRWFTIGAYDIEHADHDGSASAAEVYRYFSMVMDAMPNPEAHLCHLHETKRVASASVLAALHAGITRFEGTLGGLGGQPANFLDDCPVRGTGEYYYKDHRYVGLITLEDLLVMIDELGIEHGYDVGSCPVAWKQDGKDHRPQAPLRGHL